MAKLTIGTVELDNNIILGPMAGVTDLPFRLLCKEQGCGLMYTEMVSAKAILYNNKNTDALLKVEECERPIAVQLFGSDPKIISEMAKRIEAGPYDIFDVNMGCPVPKVVNNNEGSALMKNPRLVGEILSSLVKAIEKPVTVKIRKGFNRESVNAVEIAKIAQESGVSAIAVHGRTREDYYSGRADWDIIRQVKKAVSIPVIGNGDVFSAKDAVDLIEKTGCDGVMVARGAKGNPWIFSDIISYQTTGILPEHPSLESVKQMILRHAKLQLQYKGEYLGIREMRKHVAWYTAGMPHSASIRRAVNQMESIEELEKLLDMWISF